MTAENFVKLQKGNLDVVSLASLEELRSKLVLGVMVDETEIEDLIDYFQNVLLYPEFFYCIQLSLTR